MSASRLVVDSERLAKPLRALSNDKRLLILKWLKQPTAHFRKQVDGDLVEDGVCGFLLAEKLGTTSDLRFAQATSSIEEEGTR